MEYDVLFFDKELSNWKIVGVCGRISNKTIANLILNYRESLLNFEKTFMDFITSYHKGRFNDNNDYDYDLLNNDLSNLFSSFLFKLEENYFIYKVNRSYTFKYKLSLQQSIREYKIKKVLEI
jgi:hypothetical protein